MICLNLCELLRKIFRIPQSPSFVNLMVSNQKFKTFRQTHRNSLQDHLRSNENTRSIPIPRPEPKATQSVSLGASIATKK